MNKAVVLGSLVLGLSMSALAGNSMSNDIRNEAVKNSSIVKAVIKNLNSTQGLLCQMGKDEDGLETIQYLVENNRKKFIALYPCDDGRSAVFKGILGDGGQVALEKFELAFAN